MFSTLILCRRINARSLAAASPTPVFDKWSQCFPCAMARSRVRAEPPVNSGATVKINCSVRVAHVPLGSLGVFGVRRFLQFVTCLDCAILSQSPLRAPTAVRDAMFDGKIQRRAIHARLPAGNDFLDDETR